MKRLITTAMVLSLLSGAVAQAGAAGAVVGQRDWQGQQGGGDRGSRGGGGRGDNGGGGRQPQQQQSQPQQQQPSGGDRGDRSDRGGGSDGGGRSAPPPQQPQQQQSQPQAQSSQQGRDRGGWQGQRGQNQNGQGGRGGQGQGGSWGQGQGRPDQGRPDQGGRPSGWDRPGQGGRPDQGRPGQGRPGDSGQWRDRDNNRQRYDQRRYRPAYQSSQRYRAGAYRYPRGFYVNRWSFGDYLPGGWYGQSYYLNAGAYGLPYPPAGCEWVRVGDDAILVDVWSGQVLSVYYDLFW